MNDMKQGGTTRPIRNRPPCFPTCDQRTAECHATCERYGKWRAALDAENAQRHKDDEVNDYTVRLVMKITDKTRRK